MSNFRLMLLSTAAAGLVAVAVSPASAGEVEKSVAISGHVNRAIVVSDDGEATTMGQIDNTYVSGSRARIDAKAKSESMTVRAYTELGIQANGAADSQDNATSRSINLRHSYISVGSDMGTLTIGHTSTAGAYYISNNLGGTGNSGFYDGPVLGGQRLHVKGDTGTAGNNTTTGSSIVSVGAVTDSFQGGGSRKSNIKYDSPNFSGFSFAVGHSDDDHGSAGINYSGDFDGTKVIWSAGVRSEGGTASIEKEMGTSVAVALAGGINASLAYSKRDLSAKATAGLKDPDFWGASLGYTMGANAIQAQYSSTSDRGANGNEGTRMALVVQHNMSDYGASIYGGISNTDFDTPATATQYDDLTGGWVGIRVNF